jgi:hypothetical protein
MSRRRFVAMTALAAAGWAAGRSSRAADGLGQPLLFSRAVPGPDLPPGWRVQTLPGIAPNSWTMEREPDGSLVAQVVSSGSASSMLYPVPVPLAQAQRLRWRWRSDALVTGPPPTAKAGDDFAGRVYVLFDYPLQRVPIGQRLLLRLARSMHGDVVPAAALCYVRDARLPEQSLFESAYTSRVRMIVARDSTRLDIWFDESRNLLADFQRAFGAEYGPGMPPIAAIALAADTDQTGSRVTTRFGDLQMDTGPAGPTG